MPKAVFILSGKGGVGKSTFSILLSLYLSGNGYRVSLLDLDICGPSLSCFLGISSVDIVKNQAGAIIPFKFSENLNCLSMSFLLSNPDAAITWRGPRKNAIIKEFCTNVEWGPSDFLIIDTPPGIQDEHITLAELFHGNKEASALMVTTPHHLSVDDVQRQISFCKKTGIKLLGIVENMKYFKCPNCQECFDLFQDANVKKLCFELETHYIGNIPILTELAELMDKGKNYFSEKNDSNLDRLLKNIFLLINT